MHPYQLETMSERVDGLGPFNVGDDVSVLAWRFDAEHRRENQWRCAYASDEYSIIPDICTRPVLGNCLRRALACAIRLLCPFYTNVRVSPTCRSYQSFGPAQQKTARCHEGIASGSGKGQFEVVWTNEHGHGSRDVVKEERMRLEPGRVAPPLESLTSPESMRKKRSGAQHDQGDNQSPPDKGDSEAAREEAEDPTSPPLAMRRKLRSESPTVAPSLSSGGRSAQATPSSHGGGRGGMSSQQGRKCVVPLPSVRQDAPISTISPGTVPSMPVGVPLFTSMVATAAMVTAAMPITIATRTTIMTTTGTTMVTPTAMTTATAATATVVPSAELSGQGEAHWHRESDHAPTSSSTRALPPSLPVATLLPQEGVAAADGVIEGPIELEGEDAQEVVAAADLGMVNT